MLTTLLAGAAGAAIGATAAFAYVGKQIYAYMHLFTNDIYTNTRPCGIQFADLPEPPWEPNGSDPACLFGLEGIARLIAVVPPADVLPVRGVARLDDDPPLAMVHRGKYQQWVCLRGTHTPQDRAMDARVSQVVFPHTVASQDPLLQCWELLPPEEYRVHEGFAAIADLLYPQLEPLIEKNVPVVLAGHSMGGAVAMLLAFRFCRFGSCVVYTYGCPRIMNPAMADALPFEVIRVINTADIVTDTPPVLMHGKDTDTPAQYAHVGRPVVFTDNRLSYTHNHTLDVYHENLVHRRAHFLLEPTPWNFLDPATQREP